MVKNLYCCKCEGDMNFSEKENTLSCDCTVIVVGSPEYENPKYPIIDQDENPDPESDCDWQDDYESEMWEEEDE